MALGKRRNHNSLAPHAVRRDASSENDLVRVRRCGFHFPMNDRVHVTTTVEWFAMRLAHETRFVPNHAPIVFR